MDMINCLSSGVTQLEYRLDQVSTHLLILPAPAPDSTQDSAPLPLPNHPCQPFIPTPCRYSGVLRTSSQFLYQCYVVFDQQPLTCLTDRSKIAFIMSLLSDKASAWVLVMGIPALLREPVLMARLTKKSRLFRLPTGSSDFFVVQCKITIVSRQWSV